QSYLSQDPFINKGTALLEFHENKGRIIGLWDGRDKSGVSVSSGTYIAKIISVDSTGNEYELTKTFSVILENTAGIQAMHVFYDRNSIRFTGTIENAEWIKVKIYNIKGEIIRGYSPDSMNFEWDMKTASGTRAASGIYIAVITYKDGATGRVGRDISKIYVHR
ncbi:MAG TPA: hypothetical protein PKJ42_03840, partial [Candidatus Goldiibacteriota bacterium]|nr:hypothetical protein [Candidatus Goldiibacteriota bacterium]